MKTASDVLNKYFNAVPEESEIEEAEAVEAALPEDLVSGEDAVVGEMEADWPGHRIGAQFLVGRKSHSCRR